MHGNLIDLTGRTFGRWRVIGLGDERRGHHRLWLCECACGVTRLVDGDNLRGGLSQSCGCFSVDVTTARSTRHGHARRRLKSRAYVIWNNMIRRCTDPKNKRFKDYGGRGITVCERWLIFANFLADMDEPPPGLTLDRRDNDKGYSPDNCRWATHSEQRRNQRPCRSHSRRSPSAETRVKIAATKRGRKLSPEHIAKVAAELRGRKQTLEHAARRAASRRANDEARKCDS